MRQIPLGTKGTFTLRVLPEHFSQWVQGRHVTAGTGDSADDPDHVTEWLSSPGLKPPE
jgi:hypothetical protein